MKLNEIFLKDVTRSIEGVVKADDVGVYLAQRGGAISAAVGRALVHGMPPFLKPLSLVGTVAMLWVGGHILLAGMNELGLTPLYSFVHHLEHEAIAAAGGFVGWLVNTLASALFGLMAGAVVVAILHLIPRKKAH